MGGSSFTMRVKQDYKQHEFEIFWVIFQHVLGFFIKMCNLISVNGMRSISTPIQRIMVLDVVNNSS